MSPSIWVTSLKRKHKDFLSHLSSTCSINTESVGWECNFMTCDDAGFWTMRFLISWNKSANIKFNCIDCFCLNSYVHLFHWCCCSRHGILCYNFAPEWTRLIPHQGCYFLSIPVMFTRLAVFVVLLTSKKELFVFEHTQKNSKVWWPYVGERKKFSGFKTLGSNKISSRAVKWFMLF